MNVYIKLFSRVKCFIPFLKHSAVKRIKLRKEWAMVEVMHTLKKVIHLLIMLTLLGLTLYLLPADP